MIIASIFYLSACGIWGLISGKEGLGYTGFIIGWAFLTGLYFLTIP